MRSLIFLLACLWTLACFIFLRSGTLHAGIRAFTAFAGCATLFGLLLLNIPLGGSLEFSLSFVIGLACAAVRLIHLSSLPAAESARLSLANFVLGLLWVFIPVSRNSKPRAFMQVLRTSIELLAYAVLKMITLMWLRAWLLRCLPQPLDESLSYATYVQYSALYLVLFLLSLFPHDLCKAIIEFLSADRLTWPAVNDWPILSSTPQEFWSRRYNLYVKALLHEDVFLPLKRQAQLPAELAAFAAFVVSGAVHGLWVWIAFDSVAACCCMLVFFAIEGCFAGIARFYAPSTRLKGALFTHLQLFLMAPLFMYKFIEAGPRFLELLPNAQPLHLFSFLTPSYCPQ